MGLSAVATLPEPRHRSRDVLQVVQSLRRKNPHIGKSELAEQLADELMDDRDLLLAVSHDLVRAALTPAKVKAKPTLKAAETARRQRVSSQQAEKQAAEVAAAKVRALVILDTIMPNGEKLRFCRGSDVAQWGAGFSRIAEKVGPDCLVGEVLCEREAAELMGRPAV